MLLYGQAESFLLAQSLRSQSLYGVIINCPHTSHHPNHSGLLHRLAAYFKPLFTIIECHQILTDTYNNHSLTQSAVYDHLICELL
jgi:hypothetical protein